MGRLCERPACSEPGAIGYGFDADRFLVWLTALDPSVDEFRGGVLCRRHADAMVVPLGWTLDDRRDTTPRLFRPAAPVDGAAPPAPRRKRRPRGPRPATPSSPLPLETEPVAPTVAEVTGEASTADDPDATVATPWVPEFDTDDDLGGVLGAESPLLARAFRGRDRRRPHH